MLPVRTLLCARCHAERGGTARVVCQPGGMSEGVARVHLGGGKGRRAGHLLQAREPTQLMDMLLQGNHVVAEIKRGELLEVLLHVDPPGHPNNSIIPLRRNRWATASARPTTRAAGTGVESWPRGLRPLSRKTSRPLSEKPPAPTQKAHACSPCRAPPSR